MAVELVTGFAGYGSDGAPNRHVSSSEDGARQAGTVGTGMYVMETVDDPLAATLENSNTVTVGPGDVLMNGRHVQLTGSTSFAIPVGTQAMQTSNLLVLRYTLGDSGVESVEALTLTGSPAESDPQDPAINSGSILDGDSPVDMPLYRVVTNGIESEEPVALFRTIPPLVDVSDALDAFKAPGAIKTANLADDAVTAAKIATNAVTADGIAAGAVGSSELASNSVQTAKIAANAVTSDKLAQSVRDSISLTREVAVNTGSVSPSEIFSIAAPSVSGYTAVSAAFVGRITSGGWRWIVGGPVTETSDGSVNIRLQNGNTGSSALSGKVVVTYLPS